MPLAPDKTPLGLLSFPRCKFCCQDKFRGALNDLQPLPGGTQVSSGQAGKFRQLLTQQRHPASSHQAPSFLSRGSFILPEKIRGNLLPTSLQRLFDKGRGTAVAFRPQFFVAPSGCSTTAALQQIKPDKLL